MIKVALGTAPSEDSRAWVGGFPPMGILYLASYLRNKIEAKIEILDGLGEGLTQDQAAERLLEFDPDIVGLTAWSTTIERSLRLLKRVKQSLPGTTTILGGPHATIFDHLLLREIPELDFVFRGEAELGFTELCSRLCNGEDTAGIPGLSYRRNGEVVSSKTQIVEDLDALPFPARDLINHENYYKSWGAWFIPRTGLVATLISSRGCPNECDFCSRISPEYGSWRPRSAENILREILHLSQQGYKGAAFADDNFSANVKRVHQLCDMMLNHDLTMRFGCDGTLHNLSQTTLDLMHRAGFDAVAVGVESGSDSQLRRFRKPSSTKGLASGIQRAKKAHMIVGAYFITGGSGETENDFEASKEFLRTTTPHVAEAFMLQAHPGSRLWMRLHDGRKPVTVEETRSRMAYDFHGEIDRKTVERRRRDFHKAFALTWLNWRRIVEIYDLSKHNPTVREILANFLKTPFAIIQLLFNRETIRTIRKH